MSKQVETMVQCHLITFGGAHYSCWLPKEFSIVGKAIEVDVNGDGNFTSFMVLQTWTELPTPVVRERSQDYKRTRKASDI